MSKIIEIHYCSMCPHNIGTHCGDNDTLRQVDTYPRIPEWCPLEDKKSEP